jgi:hypothetical protein
VRKIKATLTSVATVALMFGGPAALAKPSCTDLAGKGKACTDQSKPGVTVGVHAKPLNICIVINGICP